MKGDLAAFRALFLSALLAVIKLLHYAMTYSAYNHLSYILMLLQRVLNWKARADSNLKLYGHKKWYDDEKEGRRTLTMKRRIKINFFLTLLLPSLIKNFKIVCIYAQNINFILQRAIGTSLFWVEIVHIYTHNDNTYILGFSIPYPLTNTWASAA